MQKLEAAVDAFGLKLKRACISKSIAIYLTEAVLIPRVLYPLSVIPFTPAQIRRLESRALRWVLPAVGLSPTFSRNLVGAPVEQGGLGWDRWTGRVAVIKSQLAMDLTSHPAPAPRLLWAALRHRHLLSHPLAQSGNFILKKKIIINEPPEEYGD